MDHKLQSTKSLNSIIDTENYKPCSVDLSKQTIDMALEKNNMLRVKSFVYNVGDCLFYSFEFLLHMRYTSTELRIGTIDHFINCLEINDHDALYSYGHELDPQGLYEMHGVSDVDTYLRRMRLPAILLPGCNENGLWGDAFCIGWLARWLKIEICVWSSTRKSKYLHFNKNLQSNAYSILFHDQNPTRGHFEPLINKKMTLYMMQNRLLHNSKTTPATTTSFVKDNFVNVVPNLCKDALSMSDCGDNLFNTIATLTDNEYDGPSVRRYMAHLFDGTWLNHFAMHYSPKTM